MALTAGDIISRAQKILQDESGVRWTEAELIDWLNDGQREVVTYQPQASATTASFTLDDTTTAQQLPVTAVAFLRAIRNTGGRAIREINRSVLDAQLPDWHDTVGTAVKYVMYDARTPREFFVYPKVTGSIEISYSALPTDVTVVGDAISLHDIYSNALVEYVLYRAYSKDAEDATNAQLAEAALKRFGGLVGIKQAAQSAVGA